MFKQIAFIASLLTGIAPAWSAEPAAQASAADVPDAMQHMIVAPKIDFANLRDPFASYLAKVNAREQATLLEKKKNLSNRTREKLEDYDLGALTLVAIFSMGGEHVAMVQDASAKGYIVRRGNYIGRNNGKVEKITDDTLYLVERALNPAGEIVDLQVTMTMKEVNE